MQALKDSGSPEFDDVLNAVKCKSYVFKLRISEDTWQDEQRIRINITRCRAMPCTHSLSCNYFLP